MRKVELLSPAKDLAIGIAAINNGADAVYIGAPAFGARKAAANSLEDIESLVNYAHRFYCRVFVTLNTILYDAELADAEKMIRRLYAIGIDALIVQDLGILRMDLPPICLHASTQMHNYDLERIKFIDRLGFQRIVLARELSLEQIRTIRKEVNAELEVFIHGALCVSLSGQCYLSQYMFGRSANRGECAQPCRMKWSVKDSAGKSLVEDKYILSLKDLNLSAYLNDLIEIGVDSFKIEGRLKDENYVANVTNYYSSLINRDSSLSRTGSGESRAAFTAEPERSFNRGYSTYFVDRRTTGLVNADSPKSIGKYIGRIRQTKGNRLLIDGIEAMNNGDGLCYLEKGELKGVRVNNVEGDWIVCNEPVSIAIGTELFRNYDHRFVMQLEKVKSVRKIRIRIQAVAKQNHLKLKCTDEDQISAVYELTESFEIATNPLQLERVKQQLMKCGDTDFVCEEVDYEGDLLFIPAAVVNAARRCLLEQLCRERESHRSMLQPGIEDRSAIYRTQVDWHHNVVNQKAVAFYREHGAEEVEYGLEKNNTAMKKHDLMHTRYCLLYELGRCRKVHKNQDLSFPLYLYNDKHLFPLEFDCGECFMKVLER
ncbi:MAG: U32 family peptidase [Odoribacter sp.]